MSVKKDEVKFVLPPQFKEELINKAERLGLKQAEYIRQLLFEDLKDEPIRRDPKFSMPSGLTEKEEYELSIQRTIEEIEASRLK